MNLWEKRRLRIVRVLRGEPALGRAIQGVRRAPGARLRWSQRGRRAPCLGAEQVPALPGLPGRPGRHRGSSCIHRIYCHSGTRKQTPCQCRPGCSWKLLQPSRRRRTPARPACTRGTRGTLLPMRATVRNRLLNAITGLGAASLAAGTPPRRTATRARGAPSDAARACGALRASKRPRPGADSTTRSGSPPHAGTGLGARPRHSAHAHDTRADCPEPAETAVRVASGDPQALPRAPSMAYKTRAQLPATRETRKGSNPPTHPQTELLRDQHNV